MELSFGTLTIDGFKCFNSMEVLELDQFRFGLHFLRGRNELEPDLGSNGAGKSSLWDAMCWCLWGRTPSGLKNPDIQSWSGPKTSIVMQVVYVDNVAHVITRQAHPNKLMLNDETAGQADIEALLGMTYDVFTNAILLGQGQPLFFDLEARTKMELFSAVLHLDRWDARSAKAGDRTKIIDGLYQTNLRAVTTQESLLQDATKNHDRMKEESDRWENNQEAERNVLAAKAKDAEKKLADIQRKHDAANLAYDGACTELQALNTELAQLRVYLQNAELELIKHKQMVDGNLIKVRALRTEIANLKKTTKCPTCGQPVTSTKQIRIDRERELAECMLKAVLKPKGIASEVADIRAQIDQLMRNHLEFAKKADAANDSLNFLTPTLTEYKTRISQWKELTTDHEALVNPFDALLQEHRRQKSKLTGAIRELKAQQSQLTTRLERARFWIKGFKDVRLHIVDEVLQELELTTNAMLPDAGLIDWQIQFSVEKESKSGTTQRGLYTTILSPANDHPVRWESWSGGEAQRLRIIGALALSEVLLNRAGVMTDLEILDEPTQHLSVEGVRDLCQFLSERARQLGRCTWYVDHQSVESSCFTSVLTVVKTKEGARLK